MQIAEEYFRACSRGVLYSSTPSERNHALLHDCSSSMQPRYSNVSLHLFVVHTPSEGLRKPPQPKSIPGSSSTPALHQTCFTTIKSAVTMALSTVYP